MRIYFCCLLAITHSIRNHLKGIFFIFFLTFSRYSSYLQLNKKKKINKFNRVNKCANKIMAEHIRSMQVAQKTNSFDSTFSRCKQCNQVIKTYGQMNKIWVEQNTRVEKKIVHTMEKRCDIFKLEFCWWFFFFC